MRKVGLVLFLIHLLFNSAFSQFVFKAKIVESDTQQPLAGATAQISTSKGAIANDLGFVSIKDIIHSTVTVTFSFVGFEQLTRTFVLPQSEMPIIALEHAHEEDGEEIIVTATRSTRTIDNIPTRVEVLALEELEEKSMMRSANIAMVLRESTGIQMQITSPSSANQSIRIQGLDGRYTQLLKDGFPMYGGAASGLSIMQIPPIDLKQIEVIKGSNSTLYGGGAIAGLVNLVSIQPEFEQKTKFMLDQTSANGSTFNGFYAKRGEKFGLSLYTSLNRQEYFDPNDDGFSDIPQIRSLNITPALYYYFNDKSDLQLRLNYTSEERIGGDINLINNNGDNRFAFQEVNNSDRLSYQLTYRNQLDDRKSLTIKNSIAGFSRSIFELTSSPITLPDFKGYQISSFSEINYNSFSDNGSWSLGANLYIDDFEDRSSLPQGLDYNLTTLGIFAQNNKDINESLSLETGFRLDYDFDFGFFALPRISLLTKINESWSTRFGGGLGYKLPTIFTEDAESRAFVGITPIDIDNTEAETSAGANFDINYKTYWGNDWTFSINQLFFYTELQNSLVFRENPTDNFFFENADGLVTSTGFETNLKLTYKDFKLFANYAFIDTKLKFDNLNRQKPLTPKHNIGAVLMYEEHGKWRVGLESYYTGRQFLADSSQTEDFWIVGLMTMRKWKNIAFYVNFENFTDTRQHRLENFNITDHIRPAFPQIWAPLEGFIVNGGIILELE